MHQGYRILWTLAVLVLAALAGCGNNQLHREQGFVFGTLVEVLIWGEDKAQARQASAEVLREFDRLHQRLHAWKPGELARLNAAFAAGQERAPLDTELSAILEDATRFSIQSGGTFNPAIGRLVALWGFHGDEFKPVRPDPKAIEQVLAANPQMSDLVLEDRAVYSRNPAVQLDLGGYAKGYALDRAAAILRERGVKNALVNIGGNIIALGERGNRPWRVGIQHPRQPGAIATLDLYDGEAIGTSGDYQRYFELDGRRYSHVIDPRTGYPAQGVQAVTVVAAPGPRAGALSDAASKPIFVAGVRGWREAARRMGIDLALLVDDKGEAYLTTRMAKRIDFREKPAAVHEVP